MSTAVCVALVRVAGEGETAALVVVVVTLVSFLRLFSVVATSITIFLLVRFRRRNTSVWLLGDVVAGDRSQLVASGGGGGGRLVAIQLLCRWRVVLVHRR